MRSNLPDIGEIPDLEAPPMADPAIEHPYGVDRGGDTDEGMQEVEEVEEEGDAAAAEARTHLWYLVGNPIWGRRETLDISLLFLGFFVEEEAIERDGDDDYWMFWGLFCFVQLGVKYVENPQTLAQLQINTFLFLRER